MLTKAAEDRTKLSGTSLKPGRRRTTLRANHRRAQGPTPKRTMQDNL